MHKIGYLGPAGTFTEQAALLYSESCPGELIGYRDVPDLIMAVQNGSLDRAIVPIENVVEGTVNVTIDILTHEADLKIVGEVVIPIHQCLIAANGTKQEDIRGIISHPQALAQCRRFLQTHFNGIPVHTASSTAAGAMEVKNSTLPLAAIANKRAAQVFGLNVLAENIEDHPHNCTRFVVLSRHPSQPTGDDKTSIVFSVNNEPGSLLRALSIFAQHGINLTRIESRPMRTRLGQYLFYVDFEGHAQDKEAMNALKCVEAISTYYKYLGSYPRFRDGSG
ncbi:MAG TPA: prephenate dehydratase [Clostridiales bacterium]|nr:prephenate dehydratase [Clostridiales bacterium]